MTKKEILRKIIHLTFRVRQFNNKCIKSFAVHVKNKKILELGSGKKYKGWYYYSAKQFFDNSNEFIQSDIVQAQSHNPVMSIKVISSQ